MPDNPQKKREEAEAEAAARELPQQIALVRSQIEAAKAKLSRGVTRPAGPAKTDKPI